MIGQLRVRSFSRRKRTDYTTRYSCAFMRNTPKPSPAALNNPFDLITVQRPTKKKKKETERSAVLSTTHTSDRWSVWSICMMIYLYDLFPLDHAKHFRADSFLIWRMIYLFMLPVGSRRICTIEDMFPGLDLSYADPVQRTSHNGQDRILICYIDRDPTCPTCCKLLYGKSVPQCKYRHH